MNEEVKFAIDNAKEQMQAALKHLEAELQKIRAGKANPSMLDSVMLEYYGTQQQLKNVASINTTDARTLVIQPFEKTMLQEVEKAIINANLGFTPMNDGNFIRINVPPLTEERRKDLVKQAKAELEHCKVSIRNARKEANDYIKDLVKDGLSEDLGKDGESDVQDLTDSYSDKADKHLETKEKEIMTV